MSPKTIIILAVLAICTTIGASLAVSFDSGARQDSRIGAALFPDLIDEANDVASITLKSNFSTLTLDRSSVGWTLRESDGYPVQTVKANGAVLDLAFLRFHEPKTNRPDKYAKLNLLDFDASDSGSSYVIVRDKDKAVLAELIVGNSKFNLPGTKTGGVYVRLPGDARAWLAQGNVNLNGQASHWLERSILSITRDRIKRVEVGRPPAKPVVVTKQSAKSLVFSLQGMPANFKLRYKDEPALIASNLEDLMLVDVRKAGTIAFAPGNTNKTVFETFDGLGIIVETTANNGGTWARFALVAKSDAAPSVTTEAKKLTERTKRWVYRVPAFRAARFTKSMAELIEPAR